MRENGVCSSTIADVCIACHWLEAENLVVVAVEGFYAARMWFQRIAVAFRSATTHSTYWEDGEVRATRSNSAEGGVFYGP